jgi:FHA domain-containing protein/trypsin-like peptidase
VRRLRLRHLNGPRRGDELIFSAPRVRIGRSRDNSLILSESDAPASSARHAEAAFEGGAWWIVDSGSRNGTFVNGARIERQRLASGDRLAFGDDQFLVAGDGRRHVWPAVAAAVVLVAVVAAVTYATRRRTALSPEQVAATAAPSVYAIAIESGGTRSIVGTAFAVDGGVLATNAHVANALRDRGAIAEPEAARAVPIPEVARASQASVTRALAIRGDTYEVSRITAITIHPEWTSGSMRADAALLRLDRGAASPLPLADGAAFRRLQRGTSLVSFGFPAVSTDAHRPRGRLSVDIVGDVRGEYVEAGLAISPGTSGSPVFDAEGAVVAVVAGGDFVKGANGAMMPTGSQANWAISVERVRELLRR